MVAIKLFDIHPTGVIMTNRVTTTFFEYPVFLNDLLFEYQEAGWQVAKIRRKDRTTPDHFHQMYRMKNKQSSILLTVTEK